MNKKSNLANFYALGAVLCWATVATAFKIALVELTYFELLLIAAPTTLLFFAVVMTVQRKWGLLSRFLARDWGMFALLGLLNPVAYYLVLFKAYSLLPAQVALPLNYTWPIVLLVVLAVYEKRRIPASNYVGLLLSLVGVAAVGGLFDFRGEGLSLWGIVLALGSALLWAFYWLVTSKSRYDSTLLLFMSFLFGSIYLWGGAFFVDLSVFSTASILAGCYVGLFEMAVPFLLWGLAVRSTSNPTLTNQLCYLAPFLSFFLIGFVLGELLSFWSYLGLGLIVGGILWNERFRVLGGKG